MDTNKKHDLLDIGLNANVRCRDGDCGRCTFLIVDPVRQRVTHLVIKRNEMPRREHLVPVSWIASSTPALIQVDCSWDDINKAEPFEEKKFMKPEEDSKSITSFRYLPYVMVENMMVPGTTKRVPQGELAVNRGAQVIASDGQAGIVDEFIVDPVSDGITHLVVREGNFLNRKAVMVPVAHIQRSEENTVHLDLTRAAVEALPSLPLWRRIFFGSEWRDYKNKKDEHQEPTGTKTIKDLVGDLSSRDVRTREYARSVIAAEGQQAVKPLETLLEHKKHQVRWEAAKTLSQMQSITAVPGLLMAMEDPQFDIRWIAAEGMVSLGRKALPALLEALKAQPDAVALRESAHHVLRSLMSPDLEEILTPVLLALEQVSPMASLPRAAEDALKTLSEDDRSLDQKGF